MFRNGFCKQLRDAVNIESKAAVVGEILLLEIVLLDLSPFSGISSPFLLATALDVIELDFQIALSLETLDVDT